LTRPLERHLDDAEIDALVSSSIRVSDSVELSEQALAEAQRHVESCEDCGRRVQRHKSVQSEFLLLAATSEMPSGPDCMGDFEWLRVAARSLPETKTRELVKHAAQCGHCGPLLRRAANCLSDEASDNEESALTSLGSARPEAQRRIAERLRLSQVNRGSYDEHVLWRKARTWPRFTRRSVWSILDSSFFRRGVAGAVLACAFVAFCWLYVRNRHLNAELVSRRTDRSALEIAHINQELAQQKERTAQLMAQLEAQKTQSKVQEHPQSSTRIVPLVLNAGLTREVGGEARLTIPPSTHFVEITLRTSEPLTGMLREELVGSDGRTIWSQELSVSKLERQRNRIVIMLPAYLLNPNDYRIRLARRSDSETTEVIATYPFRVSQ
jgi:hypothetical protein